MRNNDKLILGLIITIVLGGAYFIFQYVDATALTGINPSSEVNNHDKNIQNGQISNKSSKSISTSNDSNYITKICPGCQKTFKTNKNNPKRACDKCLSQGWHTDPRPVDNTTLN